jgi:hypothetical protein
VRRCSARGHANVALAAGLYAYADVPAMSALWDAFATGAVDEPAFFRAPHGSSAG